MKKLFAPISEETEKVLEIRGLTIRYGKAVAVNHVDLDVAKGSITTLIGSNGAGKSTILRCISGLIKPNKGEIIFDNERIDTLDPSPIVKRGIAHVPEGRRLFPEMNVFENLELGAYTKNNKKRMKDNLERILSYFPDLKPKLHQEAGSLSGGQQQMVAIGRALMAEPKLLLLDEPSIGLAPIIVQEIGQIVLDINKAGVSVLLVEQDAHVALELSQFGYVLQTGTVQMAGESKVLLENEEIKVAYLGI